MFCHSNEVLIIYDLKGHMKVKVKVLLSSSRRRHSAEYFKTSCGDILWIVRTSGTFRLLEGSGSDQVSAPDQCPEVAVCPHKGRNTNKSLIFVPWGQRSCADVFTVISCFLFGCPGTDTHISCPCRTNFLSCPAPPPAELSIRATERGRFLTFRETKVFKLLHLFPFNS